MNWFYSQISSFLSEYRLIIQIWTGRYPESGDILPLSPLERIVMSIFIAIRSISFTHICKLATNYRFASFLSEFYVILRFIILILIFFLCFHFPKWLCFTIITYCLIDGLNYRLCIIFVDRYAKDWGLRSLNRSLILLFINYAEIIVGFASLYLLSGSIGYNKNQILSSPGEALYFSVVTITTLGYGDLKPIHSIGRWLTIIETLMGIVLIVLVIGTFLTGIKNIRNVPKNHEQDLND
jgi:voltage-gated potassium channel Kch